MDHLSLFDDRRKNTTVLEYQSAFDEGCDSDKGCNNGKNNDTVDKQLSKDKRHNIHEAPTHKMKMAVCNQVSRKSPLKLMEGEI